MTAIIPYAELARIEDDSAQYPAWASIRVECMRSGTDWETMGWLLATFKQASFISLKIRGRAERLDAHVIDVNRIGPTESEGPEASDGQTGGIVVRAAGPLDGEPTGPEVFIPYVDVEALGVY